MSKEQEQNIEEIKLENYGKLIGFRLKRDTFETELYGQDFETMKKVKNILRTKLNQMNFRIHYQAQKKIGVGHFASVSFSQGSLRYEIIGIFGNQ